MNMGNNESSFQTGRSFETIGKAMPEASSGGCRIPIEQLLDGVSPQLRKAVLADLIAFEINCAERRGKSRSRSSIAFGFPRTRTNFQPV